MIFDKWRIEQDLESIKRSIHAQMSDIEPVVESEEPVKENVNPYDNVRVGIKDIFAMIIAVFSLLLPFLITILVVSGLFLLFMFRNVIF